MSYSCGKDSTLALEMMLEAGHKPAALLIMVNKEQNRVFFHGADEKMVEAYGTALGIPVICCQTDGENYHLAMEEGLRKAIGMGAEAVAFGDIDIEANRLWSEDRCFNVGLPAVFPLWQYSHRRIVEEQLSRGYQCILKTVNSKLLPPELAGRAFNEDTVDLLRNLRVDISGENGEFHTLVSWAPCFKCPIPLVVGKTLHFGDYATADVFLKKE